MPESVEAMQHPASAPPPDWVPVEQRWLGMDRRTLLPAGLVAALVALTFWVLPAIDDATAVDDPTVAGDVIQVDEIRFTPATGWNLEEGLRSGTADSGTYPEHAKLTKDSITFEVQTGGFAGSAKGLIDQIKKNNDKLGKDGADVRTGELTAFATSGGDKGVLARFTTTTSEGLIGAIVDDGTGVQITVYGPIGMADQPDLQNEIVSMIRSIERVEGAA